MKILYAIQGTGNGHISRARDIIPHLKNHGELDLLISGTQADVNLPYEIKYKLKGISFTFGKHGGIDLFDSAKNLRPLSFWKDLHEFPVKDYDLIINDFEPVSAWACKLQKKECIALSHQSAYLSDKTPRPKNHDIVAEQILKNYAPSTDAIGFHFGRYDTFIHTPVIRGQIRQAEVSHNPHITVYLPAYSEEMLIKHFEKIQEVEWHVFSKHTKETYRKGNIHVAPVNNDDFVKSLASGQGLLTNGGFESPAEAVYLGKKVMVIPMSNQYEQQCNALGLQHIGGTTIPKINKDFEKELRNWILNVKPVNIDYPDETGEIVAKLVKKYS